MSDLSHDSLLELRIPLPLCRLWCLNQNFHVQGDSKDLATSGLPPDELPLPLHSIVAS
jgi:hypothetical protein